VVARSKGIRRRIRWRPSSAGVIAKIVLVLVALLVAVLPMPQRLIERAYSTGIYPFLQAAVTPLTNRAPFALIDLWIIILALGLPAWWCIRIIRARGHRLRTVGTLSLNTLVLAAVLFLVFELLWGLNYSRQPLMVRLDYDEHRLSADAVRQLKRFTIETLNAESEEVHSTPWPAGADLHEKLSNSLSRPLGQLARGDSLARPVPKTSIFNFYLSAAGIAGLTNPFGYEVILDREILPFERPFLLAHEWAHLAGFADESEASFLGIVACLQSDSAALRYSGLLALYDLTPSPSKGGEQPITDPMPHLKSEVVADLKAIDERIKRHARPDVMHAQWAVYDRFLKANRVEAGVASYGLALRLMVGTRFDPQWVPVLRAAP
jgi:uncharacterized protein DUF3810